MRPGLRQRAALAHSCAALVKLELVPRLGCRALELSVRAQADACVHPCQAAAGGEAAPQRCANAYARLRSAQAERPGPG